MAFKNHIEKQQQEQQHQQQIWKHEKFYNTKKKRFPYILFLSLSSPMSPRLAPTCVMQTTMKTTNNANEYDTKSNNFDAYTNTHTHKCNTLVIETFSWSWERLKQI